MNLKQITVGDETIYVRPLSYREHKQMIAQPSESKTDFLIEHIITDQNGNVLTQSDLDRLGMDVIHAAIDHYLSLGRSKN